MRSTRARGAKASNVLTLIAASTLAGAPVVGGGLIEALLGPSVAHAQFDDEFDDEFEERQLPPQRTAASEPAASSDDEFGDGGASASSESTSSSSATTSSTSSSASSAPGERVTDPRGDLLSTRASRAWRQRRFPLHNTWGGAVGGIHVVDAGSGPSESFRVQLLTNFFIQNGFLNPDDNNQHIGGSVSLSYTPFDFLEVYGSIQSYANSNTTEDPSLFQVLGDSILGAKGYFEVLPWLTVGGDFSLALLNTVGDIGLVLDSTSFNFRLNAAADFRALQGVEIPLIARLNVGYYLDRSSALTNAIEQARYDALPTTGADARRSYEEEDRQLLTRVERFALGINRTDSLNLGIGVEAPIQVMPDFTISPILEWTVGVPVNSRNYSCLWLPSEPGGSTPAAGQDGCLQYAGFAAVPSNLTVAVRVLPPIRGLALTVGADIGTSGTANFVRELAGNAPYNIYLGASYAVDTVPPPAEVVEREVERRVEVPAAAPVRGRIAGIVVERGTTTPVRGAVVALTGRELTALSTGADGHFTTYELEPGDVALSVSHPEYQPGDCTGTIPADGGDVNVTCEVTALPRMGNVHGRVVGDDGQPVSGATLQITGPQGTSFTTDASGGFVRDGLPPGTYTARVEAENYLITTSTFEVRARETAQPEITVIARPRRSLVQLRARELVIRRQVNFATDSADILPDSVALLTEVADVLLRHPELTAIEIQGHTDNRGGSEHNMELSQRRADSVRDWLVRAGVDASRLTARGYGDTQPRGPNITASMRARNRRVQFMIQGREGE